MMNDDEFVCEIRVYFVKEYATKNAIAKLRFVL